MAPIGDAEAMKELFASFGLAMFTGVMCINLMLVLLFKDFMRPATILWALVLSVPGAFLALYLTHTAISMPSTLAESTRPIVMTTMAMGAGMLPVALDMGRGDGTFRSRMAIVVVGGLISSTLPSFLVIPVAYSYVDDWITWGSNVMNRAGRRRFPEAKPATEVGTALT